MAGRKFVVILILFAINLLNYCDRFTIAGVLTDVANFYEISDQTAGILQTVFIIFFMIFAPISGYLGDRFNRKCIIMFGEIIWVGAVLASSFIPKEHFWLFALLRGIVGIGEASYVVLAPTLIADLFVGKMRSRILMFFYFAIPVTIFSGLGYVISSSVTSIAKGGRNDCSDCWQWGIRATPLIGLITMVALIIGVEEPKRGQAEYEKNSQNELQNLTDTIHKMDNIGRKGQMKRHLQTVKSDLAYLARNLTFVWSTIGYTAVVFVTGTLTWWSPAAIEQAIAWHQNVTKVSLLPNKIHVSLIFGIITCLGGIVGVAIGSILAMAWKQGKWFFARHATPKADCLISAIGSFAAAPFLFLAILLLDWDHLNFGWAILFVTIVCLCLNWAVNVDMLMFIIVPNRRSMASAVQARFEALVLGEWILGYKIDLNFSRIWGRQWPLDNWCNFGLGPDQSTPATHFHALKVAFYGLFFLLLLSGFAFLGASYTLSHTIRQMEKKNVNSNVRSDINKAEPENENNDSMAGMSTNMLIQSQRPFDKEIQVKSNEATPAQSPTPEMIE